MLYLGVCTVRNLFDFLGGSVNHSVWNANGGSVSRCLAHVAGTVLFSHGVLAEKHRRISYQIQGFKLLIPTNSAEK